MNSCGGNLKGISTVKFTKATDKNALAECTAICHSEGIDKCMEFELKEGGG